MITFIGFESNLLDRFESLLLHSLDLLCENRLWGRCRVNAASLDRDHAVAAHLQEVLRVDAHDTRLVRLGDIRKDGVDHGDKHSVLVRVTGILNDGHDIGALLGHVQKLTARTVRKLDGVDSPSGPHEVGNVRNSGTRGGAEIEHLGPWSHPDLADTASDGGTEFGTERIPNAIFLLIVSLRL